MGLAAPKYAAQLNGERSLENFIPYTSLVSPNTIMTRQGDVLRTWKIDGIPHETTDPDDLNRRAENLNVLLRSMASTQVAMTVHNVRRKVSDRLQSHFDDTFSRDLDKKYFDSFTGYKMMATEIYITIAYRPVVTAVDKAARRSARRSKEDVIYDLQQAIAKLDELSLQVESSLRRYGPQVLSTYEGKDGATCSEQLEFINFLITGEWQPVRVPNGPLYSYLGNAYMFAGVERIVIRTPERERYAQMLDFKDFPHYSEVGHLNLLMYEESEYILTQHYNFMSTFEGKKFLEKQRNQLKATEDGSQTQIAQMDQAIDDLVSGHFGFGEYSATLLMFADTPEQLDKTVARASASVKELGFLVSKVATAIDAGFYSQMPGNWAYRPRIAGLTTRNYTGLASLHNFEAGKRNNNPWGPAVTLLKTPSLQPFYFNFHFTRDDEDATDKKVLGNTRIIGQSGAGKTVLMNFLLSQSQKFKDNSPTGFTAIFFDKDRGAELLIRAIGGHYHAIKNGVPTGFNVMQMEPTEGNIVFAEQWIAARCKGEPDAFGNYERLTASDYERISHAVRTVFKMPRELRGIRTVTQNMTKGISKEERENSLVKRLEKWCWGAPLGWVADCPRDTLDFTKHYVHGFDGTEFLDNRDVCSALSSYMLHRMEEVIDGRRFMYFMDEAWKWVDDDAFSEFAGNKQLTIRKQNGLGVFATQMPSSLLKSKCGSALVQQCATEIYLPNPKADRSEYMDGFKVTETEFEMIRDFPEESRLFLVKQGHRSAVVKLDLGGSEFNDDLSILSGSTDNIELLDSIIEEVGDDPDVWLPIFHERRKARAAITRKA